MQPDQPDSTAEPDNQVPEARIWEPLIDDSPLQNSLGTAFGAIGSVAGAAVLGQFQDALASGATPTAQQTNLQSKVGDAASGYIGSQIGAQFGPRDRLVPGQCSGHISKRTNVCWRGL